MCLSTAGYGASTPKKIPDAYAYCFTLNNPTYQEWFNINSLLTNGVGYGIIYYGYGLEKFDIVISPNVASGQFHLQGVIVSKSKMPLAALKKISRRAHWEPMSTTLSTCILYCSKEGKFVSMGDYQTAIIRLEKKRRHADYSLYKVKQFSPEDVHSFMLLAMFGGVEGSIGLDMEPDYGTCLNISVHHQRYFY